MDGGLELFMQWELEFLEKNPEIVGLKTQFSIIDIDDQIRLVKQALSYHNVDEKNGPQD